MQQQRSSRNAGLDGLRALSIIAILLYHLKLPILGSGHMGVVIFLVLSGYLVTAALVRAHDADGRTRVANLLRTWGRRLLRIWPSVAAMVVIVVVLCGSLSHVLLTKMRPDIMPSLGFYLNWSYISRNVSYFDLIGGTSPLLHLWYLGCDMQFYLIWTLVLAFLLKIGKRFARRVAFVAAVASAIWMAVLYVPGGDPSRIYYGTDTRAFSLLLGAWLALAFPLGKRPAVCGKLLVKDLDEEQCGPGKVRATVWAHLLGVLSLAGIIAAMVLIPSDSDLWYRGGMFVFSLLVVLFTATLLAPMTIVRWVLSLAPLRLLGVRSFSLYLWHYPVFLLMGADKSTTPWWMRLAAVGVSLVAAELSLHVIERPFAPSHAVALPATDGDGEQDDHAAKAHKRTVVIRGLSLVGIIACAIWASQVLEITPEEFLVPQDSLVSTGSAADVAIDLTQSRPQGQNGNGSASDTSGKEDATGDGREDETSRQTVTVTDKTVVWAPPSEVDAGMYDPVLIGDSVPGDAGNEFVAGGLGWEGRLPNALIDTFIGRRPDQALEVLRGYLEQNAVGKVIVLACFSNSTPLPETLDAMIDAAGADREVYLVGTVNPDGFQDTANANLQAAAEAHENVHYVDWPAVLEGHLSEYLWADATHLQPAGAKAYVDMVVRAVAQSIVDAGGSVSEA